MKRKRFEELVSEALDELPEEFRGRLENVDIIVESRPSPEVLRENGISRNGTLLGLYHGVPLNHRGTGYGSVLPDVITLYQEPIESMCVCEGQVKREIMDVLTHEIGHHFGMSEEELP